uniref:Chaperone DnaJ C-terminal domain-containing protein n=1 Tax=Hanusia phi TaxID=3032 RepID=A0A7S0ERM2_9CRYP
MGGRSHGRFGHRRRQASPPEPVEQKFYCTLEELFRGCQKKFKILSSRIVTIDVKPGWKAGTKVSFNEQGQTIKFVLCEHPHKWFVRDGDDLRWKCKLTRQQAKKGVQLTIPMLDGTEVKWSTKGEQVYHGSCIAIASHGMPIKGGPARGNLIIEFALTD